MKISVLSMFPQMFSSFDENPLVKRAISSKELELKIVDIKEHTKGSFRKIDDSPCGGGKGMILRVDALFNALEAVRTKDSHVVLFSPKGKTLDQQKVKELAQKKDLILVCGHYEGVDARFESYVDEMISIGDYVLSGGEYPAMVLCDSLVRLLPGVLKDGCTTEESFEDSLLEHCQFTHPVNYNGQIVPTVLLSGNDKQIALYKEASSLMETAKYRPELLYKAAQKDTIGMSESSILLFDNFVMKINSNSEEALREYKAYQWLQNKVKTPKIADFYQNDNCYLLMERIKDNSLCSDYFYKRPSLLIKSMCNALKELWSVDISDCSFDSSPEAKLKIAEQNIKSKTVDLDPDCGFESPNELFQWLSSNIPSSYEKVLSHGDMCLPNIFVSKKGKISFIDVGLCGVGDKYCDIAISLRSLKRNADGKYNHGQKQFDFNTDEFFAELGIKPDWERIRWYTLLDELF